MSHGCHVLFAASILLAASPAATWGEATPARPNVVIFLADDLSWSDCSMHGKSGIETPNMERVARAGMTFSHAFVDSPSCAPSRGAMLTGLTPARNGAMYNHTVPELRHRRWPAYFREAGYQTAAIGKVAHYATVQQYGFDHVSHFKYHEDDCVEAAVAWLKQRKARRPLCLFVGTNWPHVPWPEKTKYGVDRLPLPENQVDTPETRLWRTRYAQSVSDADRDLGLVYDAAREVLGDNTLFLFTSDHGSQFPFGKWNCYDGGIRTPLLAVWPGKIAPGSDTDAMVSWIDLLPTCLDAIHAPVPESGTESDQISGRSFLPVLLGKADEHRDLIFATHSGDGSMNEYPIRAVRSRQWKYVRNLAPDRPHHTHVDQAQAGDGKGYWSSWARAAESDETARKLVNRYHRRPAEELYDLAADPWEQHNLVDDPRHASQLADLRRALDEWMTDQGDQGLVTEQARKPPKRK